MAYSNPQTKKYIECCFREKVDLSPTKGEIDGLWEYFGSRCAYCGLGLHRERREGHKDHIVANGLNHISNRALSCKWCNGDEKREKDWKEFIFSKCEEKMARRRIEKIKNWMEFKKLAKEERDLRWKKRAIADELSNQVCNVLEKKITELKKKMVHLQT